MWSYFKLYGTYEFYLDDNKQAETISAGPDLYNVWIEKGKLNVTAYSNMEKATERMVETVERISGVKLENMRDIRKER